VAQAALTLILAVAGRLTERQLLMRQGTTGWREGAALAGTSLRGKTLGVVGPGAIGQALFQLTDPFEFRKLAFGAHTRPEIAARFGFSYVELDELCLQSDILVLACPLNAQTRGLMSAKRLALLKETAILVNVARGGVIDEGALIKALSENRIAGAGLDVFEDEPTPPDNPLLSMPNVVATPHGLAVTNEGYLAALDEVARGMRAVLEGREAENLVSPAAEKQS
jgi:phosphoglycerate dehydrogenase-like enzyme